MNGETGKIYWGSDERGFKRVQVRGYVGTDAFYSFIGNQENFKEKPIQSEETLQIMDQCIGAMFDLLQHGGAITTSGILLASSSNKIPFPILDEKLHTIKGRKVKDHFQNGEVNPATTIVVVPNGFDTNLTIRNYSQGGSEAYYSDPTNTFGSLRNALEAYVKGTFMRQDVAPIISPSAVVRQTFLDAAKIIEHRKKSSTPSE